MTAAPGTRVAYRFCVGRGEIAVLGTVVEDAQPDERSVVVRWDGDIPGRTERMWIDDVNGQLEVML